MNFALFRERFPKFATKTDEELQEWYDVAILYIPETGRIMTIDQREQAIFLLICHLLTLSEMASRGQTPALVSSSAVDKVSVSTTPPPFGSSQFAWWLSITPCGQALNALIKTSTAGGSLVGGSCEISAIRKCRGRF